MTGYTAVLVALAATLVGVSYAREHSHRIAAWVRWRMRRPPFDSSAAYRRELALWRQSAPRKKGPRP